MRISRRISTAALASAIAATTLIAPIAAQADRRNSKDAAIALGAVSLALLATQRNKTPGIIAGVGALVAYSEASKRRDCDRDRYSYVEFRNDRFDDRNYRTEDCDHDRDSYFNDRHNYRERDYDRNRSEWHDYRHDRDNHSRDDYHSRR